MNLLISPLTLWVLQKNLYTIIVYVPKTYNQVVNKEMFMILTDKRIKCSKV